MSESQILRVLRDNYPGKTMEQITEEVAIANVKIVETIRFFATLLDKTDAALKKAALLLQTHGEAEGARALSDLAQALRDHVVQVLSATDSKAAKQEET